MEPNAAQKASESTTRFWVSCGIRDGSPTAPPKRGGFDFGVLNLYGAHLLLERSWASLLNHLGSVWNAIWSHLWPKRPPRALRGSRKAPKAEPTKPLDFGSRFGAKMGQTWEEGLQFGLLERPWYHPEAPQSQFGAGTVPNLIFSSFGSGMNAQLRCVNIPKLRGYATLVGLTLPSLPAKGFGANGSFPWKFLFTTDGKHGTLKAKRAKTLKAGLGPKRRNAHTRWFVTWPRPHDFRIPKSHKGTLASDVYKLFIFMPEQRQRESSLGSHGNF